VVNSIEHIYIYIYKALQQVCDSQFRWFISSSIKLTEIRHLA